MSVDLAAIRKALGTALTPALLGVNVYANAEPQPEYPALVFGPLDLITYHVAQCVEGVAIEWVVEVMVANPDQESATHNLEMMLSGAGNVVDAIEAVQPPAGEWSNLVVHEARNFRRLDTLDGFGCELFMVMHV
jgi:hypothetical protein